VTAHSSLSTPYDVGRSPRGLAVADLGGDGIPDIVVANYDDNTVNVLLGKGDGSFQPQVVYAVEVRPYAVAVATLTGDGIPDIIVANSGGDSVSVLLWRGDGTFQPPETFAVGRLPWLWRTRLVTASPTSSPPITPTTP
jgi:hypothetical protein